VVDSQMREKCSHFGRSHLLRVTLAVKQNEPLDPRDVGLLGAVGQVLKSAGMRDLVEKPWLMGLARSSRRSGGSL
jgi:hypothetical protein